MGLMAIPCSLHTSKP